MLGKMSIRFSLSPHGCLDSHTFRAFAHHVGVVLCQAVICLGVYVPYAVAQSKVERNDLGELVAPVDELTGAIIQTNSSLLAQGNDEIQPMPLPLEGASKAETIGANSSIELLDHKGPLRIGLMAERGPTYLQTRIAPFRSYLQKSLSRPVEIIAFKSIVSLIAAHAARQVDYATYPASVFAMAQASCGCLLPLVAPVSSQAPDGIFMLLIVRSESGISALSDMTGRSLALSSKNGAMPFYMGLNELRKSGLDPVRDLSSVISQESPTEALALLEKGDVDAALVWSTTQFNQSLFSNQGAISAYQNAKKRKRNEAAAEPNFLSIWRSPAIPAGPHVVHKDMSKQDRADLVKALKAMNQQDPAAYDAIERYYSGGFEAVTLEDYAPLIEVATAK